MKTRLLILLLSCFHLAGYAQDSIPASGSGVNITTAIDNSVNQKTAGVSDSLAQLTNSVNELKANLSIANYYDSASVAFYQKNGSLLYYKSPDYAKFSWINKVLGWLLFTIVLVGGVYLFACSSMCRDDAYDENGTIRPYKQKPYSYSRVQLFWWTMIILCCYISFFAMTGNLAPLNMTTVVLLGLGALVYGGGKLIDERQKNNTPTGKRNQDHNSEDVHFLTDLLTDDSGISIHRFQTLIFNLVFGIGFITFFVMAVGSREYPFADFNEWQIALLGISSATYLGVKTTENQSLDDGTDNDAANDANNEGLAQRNINQLIS